MHVVYFKLNKRQAGILSRAIANRQGFTMVISKPQVTNSIEATPPAGSTEVPPDYIPLPLNRIQFAQFQQARSMRSGLTLSFSAHSFSKKGGFIPLVPLLLAALPGLFGAAPKIIKAAADGYTNLGKLAGIVKPKAAAPAAPKVEAPKVEPVPEKVLNEVVPPAPLAVGTSLASDIVEFVVGRPRGQPVRRQATEAAMRLGRGKKKGKSLKIFGEGLPPQIPQVNGHTILL